MKGEPAVYLDRMVDKKHFRAFVYNAIGDSKLVESWDEFEETMAAGVWFSTREAASSVKDVTTKRKRKSKEYETVEELIENIGMIES